MDGGWSPGEGQHHFIGNRWAAAASGETLPVVDPSDGQPFARIARGNAADVDAAVQVARRAFGESGEGGWGRFAAAERGRLLTKLSLLVLEHAEELAHLESRTTGKPLRQGRNDAQALARMKRAFTEIRIPDGAQEAQLATLPPTIKISDRFSDSSWEAVIRSCFL